MSIHAEKLINFSQEQSKRQWAFMKKNSCHEFLHVINLTGNFYLRLRTVKNHDRHRTPYSNRADALQGLIQINPRRSDIHVIFPVNFYLAVFHPDITS